MRLRFTLAFALITMFTIYGPVDNVNASFTDVPSIGTRAEGTGGAMTALANDPISALFYNPAALTDIPGRCAEIGMGIVGFPLVYRDLDGSFLTENEFVSLLPYFAFSSDRFAPIFLGIGLYGSAGTGFDFAKNEAKGIFHHMEAESGNVYLSPTIAYRFNDKISAGVGLNIAYSKLETEMPLGRYQEEGLSIDADGFCYGVNIGLLYKPFKSLSLGLRWRSGLDAELEGDAKFLDKNKNVIAKDNVTAHIYWPDVLTFGVGVHISPKFVLLLDYEWIYYSRFSRKSHLSYDDQMSYFNSPFLKDMRDARRIHIGCEYLLNAKIVLRAGYLYNRWCLPNKQTTPLAPGNTYHTFHLGIKVKISKKFDIEFAGFKNYHNIRKVTYSETGYTGSYREPSHGIDMGLVYYF